MSYYMYAISYNFFDVQVKCIFGDLFTKDFVLSIICMAVSNDHIMTYRYHYCNERL